MQTHKFDGGEVSIWQRSDGRLEISIDPDTSEGQREIDHDPSVTLALSPEKMCDLIGALWTYARNRVKPDAA